MTSNVWLQLVSTHFILVIEQGLLKSATSMLIDVGIFGKNLRVRGKFEDALK